MENKDPNNPIRRVREEDGAMVVEVAGDVDLHRSIEFQQSLLKLLDQQPRRIVINLEDVPYMDSSGVASLVKLLSRVRQQRIELKLCCLKPRVRSVFEITRLDSVFPLCESEQEALNA